MESDSGRKNVEIKDLDDHAPDEIFDVKGIISLSELAFPPAETSQTADSHRQQAKIMISATNRSRANLLSAYYPETYRKYFTLAEDLAERKTVIGD